MCVCICVCVCVCVCKMLYLWLSYEELTYLLLNKHTIKCLLCPWVASKSRIFNSIHQLPKIEFKTIFILSVRFSSVAQSCPTLYDPMNHSMPGLPVHHQLPESTQTRVHQVGDAIHHLILCRLLLNLGELWAPANSGDRCGFDPGSRRSPVRWAWQPTPVFLPGESPWTEEHGGL